MDVIDTAFVSSKYFYFHIITNKNRYIFVSVYAFYYLSSVDGVENGSTFCLSVSNSFLALLVVWVYQKQ